MSKVIKPTELLFKDSHALKMAIQNKYDGYIELHNRKSTSFITDVINIWNYKLEKTFIFIIESVIWVSSN